MLCQQCQKNPANVKITQVINGHKTEVYLCEECAKEAGQLNFSFPFDINDLLTSMVGISESPSLPKQAVLQCSVCGMTFDQFNQGGKFGCATCYDAFRERLIPIFKRLHGGTRHTGKIPDRTGKKIKEDKEVDKLKALLNQSIQSEDYEKAAELRDKIRALEKKCKEKGAKL